MAPYLVRDFMTYSVTTVNDDTMLLEAALLLHRTGRRHLPIINADGKAVGILSDRDLKRLTPSVLTPVSLEDQNRIFNETPITAAMTKDPITVLPDTTIRQAVDLMVGRKISCVLVEEKDKLVGILTITDVLGLLARLLDESGLASA